MKALSRLFKAFNNREYRKAMHALRSMSDRNLVDCGISPELLKQGLSAWPWRELDDNWRLTPASRPVSQHAKVVAATTTEIRNKANPDLQKTAA